MAQELLHRAQIGAAIGWASTIWMVIAAGVLAVGVVIALPLPWFISLPLMVAILGADLLAYFFSRNKDKRVSESFRWSLNPSTWFSKNKKEKEEKGQTMTVLEVDYGLLSDVMFFVFSLAFGGGDLCLLKHGLVSLLGLSN
ncbi:hypothetical protein HC762_01710 [bacterium]|nr:hypothetical protein [bacterium]